MMKNKFKKTQNKYKEVFWIPLSFFRSQKTIKSQIPLQTPPRHLKNYGR